MSERTKSYEAFNKGWSKSVSEQTIKPDLVSMFQAFGTYNFSERVDSYCNYLSKYPKPQVVRAIDLAVKTLKNTPSIADLIDLIPNKGREEEINKPNLLGKLQTEARSLAVEIVNLMAPSMDITEEHLDKYVSIYLKEVSPNLDDEFKAFGRDQALADLLRAEYNSKKAIQIGLNKSSDNIDKLIARAKGEITSFTSLITKINAQSKNH